MTTMNSDHPTLVRSPDCERHALRRTRRSHWRGDDVPAHVPDSVARYGGLRGDEAVTEQMAVAVQRRDDTVLVVEHHDLDGDTRSMALVIEDDRFGERRWTIETVASPTDPRAHHRLLHSVMELPDLPATITWRPPSIGMSRFAIPFGASIERTILELRGEAPDRSITPNRVRFADAAELGAVAQRIALINNAAFGDHPEQGALTAAEIEMRQRSSWFDPSLLVIAIDEQGEQPDAGFVWMKCVTGRPAELYVVAVHPAAGIRGLGRLLVAEGFARAADKSAARGAMLFVDAANERAVTLYRSMGFRPVRRQDVVRLCPPEA